MQNKHSIVTQLKRKQIEDLFFQYHAERDRNFARILFELKRIFNHWAMENFNKEGYCDIKIAHIPVIMNISIDGTTNTELAKQLKITRQAMSKTVRELQKLNYIAVQENPNDKRSMLLFLTKRGIKMVITAKKKVSKLSMNYKKNIGESEYELMISSLLKILELHKSSLAENEYFPLA